MSTTPEIYLCAARRTPVGMLGGGLASMTAPQLGAVAIAAVLADTRIDPADVDEVLLGCVLTAGVGQAPARQAAMAAGLPITTGATTINKVCGSGMKSVMIAADTIRAGSASLVVAGGMESMSHAPHLAHVRGGLRLGDGVLQDALLRDGIDNADGRSLGLFTEETAREFGFTREQLDAYAAESVRRARAAQADGLLASQMAPVTVPARGSAAAVIISADEGPAHVDIDRIPTLAPAFRPDGVLTAASASGFCDGAAALVVASADAVQRLGLTPLARIVAQATHSQEPERFASAPVGAVRAVLQRAGWTAADVDLFEVNEALAPVPLAVMARLGIEAERMNVTGGACAIGHPIGASGARIIVALVHELRRQGARRGVASLCIGGGEATAVAVEAL